MRTGVPCNQHRFFPVRIYYTGKPLFWPCTGPVQDCSVRQQLYKTGRGGSSDVVPTTLPKSGGGAFCPPPPPFTPIKSTLIDSVKRPRILCDEKHYHYSFVGNFSPEISFNFVQSDRKTNAYLFIDLTSNYYLNKCYLYTRAHNVGNSKIQGKTVHLLSAY